MKNFIVLKYDSLAVSILTIICGFNVLIFPDLINYGEAYELLNNFLNSLTFGIIFITLGSLNLIAVLRDMPRFRALIISMMISFWTLFLICLVFSGVENGVWVLSLSMITFNVGIVIKEGFR